jgi:hypothetical protein
VGGHPSYFASGGQKCPRSVISEARKREYSYHFRCILLFWELSFRIVFPARGSSSRRVGNLGVKLNSGKTA